MGSPSKEASQSSASLTPPSVAILVKDANHRVATFGSLLISVWIHETLVEALCGMEEHLKVVAPQVPGGRLGLFVVVEPHAKMPTAEARNELSRIRRSSPISLTALVHEGNGFSAALVRGITTSLNLLDRPAIQTHVFATVAAAARCVEATAPELGSAAAIEAAVQVVRTS